jgi:multidrug resistance efflux pump
MRLKAEGSRKNLLMMDDDEKRRADIAAVKYGSAAGLVTQQTNVYNLLAQLQISKNAAEQNTVTKLNQMTDVESQLKEAERIYS